MAINKFPPPPPQGMNMAYKNPMMQMQPQKMLSKPVRPQTPSVALMACMAIMSQRVSLKLESGQSPSSVFKMMTVPNKQPTVITTEQML